MECWESVYASPPNVPRDIRVKSAEQHQTRVLYNIPLASPRSSRSTASGDKSSIVLQHKVLFVLIGLSISGEMIAPAKAEALSKRMPMPSPERNTSKRPVLGWKSLAGSSVVTRHWIAKPRGSVMPSATRICDCTKSMSANGERGQFLQPFDDDAELSNHVRTNAQHFLLCLPIVGPQCDVANSTASSLVVTGPSVPGTIGTPASIAAVRAATLSPICCTTFGDGPMKRSPASITACAKSLRSERKP
uniref:Uncharacterized protein n=1 Tax=Glossina palpalis gambiensis TaxID=67801 RepID=A0A1B0C5Z2_9MUSC